GAVSKEFPKQLLVIEAATAAGSVALAVDGVIIAERDIPMGASREDALLPAIASVLNEAGIAPRELLAIACGSGPGSFTSLRIAAALAKGFVFANDAQLFAVPSLLLAAASLHESTGNYIVHSDALRGDRYTLPIHVSDSGQVNVAGAQRRLSLAELEDVFRVASQPIALVAVGNSKVTEHDSMVVQPHARNIIALMNSWPHFGPVDVSSWEPDYGRAAEAQVKWEIAHGKALPTS
ncbi:MAG: tRNA (adenosine(37)-N6)-threonylcarbamoyltransferase complex dimerization subunit type 1 TsaB, partial [Gemmatimonadaceae bacterium]